MASKCKSMTTLFHLLLTIAVLMLFTGSALSQNNQATPKDEKYYIYSIDQLSSANKNLQEQLVQNQQLIRQLRAEKDSLYSLLMKFQSGAVVAAPKSKPSAMKAANVQPRLSGSFEDDYRKALEQFNQKRYQQALSIFKELLQRERDNSLSDNCQYWIGECYYAMKDYQQAIIEFERVLTFNNTNKDDDAQLKLGLCYLRLNDNEGARRELTRLLSNYPDSEFTQLGRKLLEGL